MMYNLSSLIQKNMTKQLCMHECEFQVLIHNKIELFDSCPIRRIVRNWGRLNDPTYLNRSKGVKSMFRFLPLTLV